MACKSRMTAPWRWPSEGLLSVDMMTFCIQRNPYGIA